MSGTVPSEPNPAKPPSHSDPASFHDAGEHLSMVLHSLSTAHRYNRWIVDLAAPYLGPQVLEVGAGDGNVASLLDIVFASQIPREWGLGFAGSLALLARDLGQLEQPRVWCVADGWSTYKAVAMRDGMIEGNIKPEPLKRIEAQEPIDIEDRDFHLEIINDRS